MLPSYLIRFNQALADFQAKFPKHGWTDNFKSSLINDYSFYSSKVEDARLEYGDTIRFLDDQLVKKEKLGSLLEVANHKIVLQSVIDRYDTLELSEDTVKDIHRDLMGSELSWSCQFKPEWWVIIETFQRLAIESHFIRIKNMFLTLIWNLQCRPI